MNLKTLIAIAVAGAFAAPLAAQASVDTDKIQIAQAGGSSGGGGATSQPSSGATPPGGPASPGSVTDQSTRGSASGRTTGDSGLFQRLDKNNDGFISRDEARDATELQGRFAELDKDNDGKISASEMRAMDSGHGATGTTGSGTRGGSSTGMGGSTGGMGGSSGPAGTSSGPNPAGEAPRGGVSR